MAFRFTLQSVLHLRQGLEWREEQRLLACAAVVTRLQDDIVQLDETHANQKRATLQELQMGSCASVLQFADVCDAAYSQKRMTLLKELREAEQKRLAQLQIYQNARQKREILDGLHERQKAAYDLEFARREQQRADEVYLLRAFFESQE